MRYVKCDNCGKDQQEPYRLPWDERQALFEDQADKVLISLEHNEDVQNFDACSWACVADIASRQAAGSAIQQIEGSPDA